MRPNRAEVTRSFPVLGFTIRTGRPAWFEVALTTDPTLFGPDARGRRTSQNFYSTRSGGTLPAQAGEAVYLVPGEVLARFAGQPRVYYALATFSRADRSDPEVAVPVVATAPSVAISESFTGTMRRLRAFGPGPRRPAVAGNGAYRSVSPGALEWAGDAARPGSLESTAPASGREGASAPATVPAAPPAQAVAAAARPFVYDDGYGPMAEPAPARTMQVVEIASAIVGAGMSRILDNEGDIHWELDQLAGLKYPQDQAANASGEAFGTTTVTMPGPRTATAFGLDNIYADSEITFQHDGRTLGNLQIAVVTSNDAVGQGLTVKAQIMNEANSFVAAGSTTTVAAIRVRFSYRFTSPIQDDAIAFSDVMLFGDGSWSRTSRWTSEAAGGLPPDVTSPLVIAPTVRAQGTPPAQPVPAPAFPAPAAWAPASPAAHDVSLELESFDSFWPDVELIPQPTNDSCWAAAAAMVAGWAGLVSMPAPPLHPEDYPQVADRFELAMQPPQSYGIDGFRRMLEDRGPIWVAAVQPFPGGPSYHAVVVTGMYGDGNPDGSDTWLRVNDPWDRLPGSPGSPGTHTGTHVLGSTYTQRWTDFVAEFEAVPLSTKPLHPLQVMYARAGTSGRRPVIGAAMSLTAGAPQSLQVVEGVASEIAGAVMTRILDNEGDISWELDQMKGVKYPQDKPENATGATFAQLDPPVPVPGPRYASVFGQDEIYADCEIGFQFDGSSVGNVAISVVRDNDAVGWGMALKAQILNDERVFVAPGSSVRMAAIPIRFQYRFTSPIYADAIAFIDVMLYGNGTWSRSSRWTQD
jgi:hypothetical protein